MSDERIWTAAVLVIGDEILSGRTQDKNIAQIATWLDAQGIRLREVRVVPDVEQEIVDALNAVRVRYDDVFTTGGIGPTHDDITVDAVRGVMGDRPPGGTRHPRALLWRTRLNSSRRAAYGAHPDGAELIQPHVGGAGDPHRQFVRHGLRTAYHRGHARRAYRAAGRRAAVAHDRRLVAESESPTCCVRAKRSIRGRDRQLSS